MSKSKVRKKYYHNKLIRDKIPEYIESKGGSYKTKTLNVAEFKTLIRKKMVEEARELVSAKRNELVNEMADVLQLLISIAKFEKIPFSEIEKARKNKEKERGAFKKKIFLVWSDHPRGKK